MHPSYNTFSNIFRFFEFYTIRQESGDFCFESEEFQLDFGFVTFNNKIHFLDVDITNVTKTSGNNTKWFLRVSDFRQVRIR